MNKVLSIKKASKLSKKLRKEGAVVVFTSGCFDILHIGHIRFLKAAKKLGGPKSILMVGVDADEYVHTAKGDGHPFLTQKVRAEMLASLAMVDWVVLFNLPRREYSDFVNHYRALSPEWVVLGYSDKRIIRLAKQEAQEAGVKFKQLYHPRKLDSSSRIIAKLSNI